MEPKQEMRRVFGISTNGSIWSLWVMTAKYDDDVKPVGDGKGKSKQTQKEGSDFYFVSTDGNPLSTYCEETPVTKSDNPLRPLASLDAILH
jgi:hypothetical protein